MGRREITNQYWALGAIWTVAKADFRNANLASRLRGAGGRTFGRWSHRVSIAASFE